MVRSVLSKRAASGRAPARGGGERQAHATAHPAPLEPAALPRGRARDAALLKAGAKLAVNDWLAAVVDAVMSRPDTRGGSQWALALETRALRTVRALEGGAGIPPSNIVVPNPCQAERAAMLEVRPGLLCVACTSHALIEQLAEGSNRPQQGSSDATAAAAAATLAARGWRGSFRIAFLDFCGALTSRAGRQRQLDILRLCRSGLLARGSILMVTVSRRGAAETYTGESEDALAALVQLAAGEALDSPLPVAHLGSVRYRVQADMLTVAFAFGDGPVASAAVEAAREKAALLPCELVWSAGGVGADFAGTFAAAALRERVGLSRAALALQDAAMVFAAALMPLGARCATVSDAKLGPAARALRERFGDALRLNVSVDDPLDALVAQSCLADSVACRDSSQAIAAAAATDGADALWLWYGNRPPFSAQQVRSAQWRDIAAVFSSGALRSITGATQCSVLGVIIPCTSVGELWTGSFVDWLVEGVRLLAAGCDERLLVRPAASWRYAGGSERQIAVIFAIGLFEDGVDAATEAARTACDAAPPPLGCIRDSPWDERRRKEPVAAAAAFARVAREVGARIGDTLEGGAEANSEPGVAAVVHEPGFFHVWPAVIEACGGSGVLACANGDRVALAEIRCRISRLAEPGRATAELGDRRAADGSSAWRGARALVLLDAVGQAVWLRSWGDRVRAWLKNAEAGALLLAASYIVSGGVRAVRVDAAQEGDEAGTVQAEVGALARDVGLCMTCVARRRVRLESRTAEVVMWTLKRLTPTRREDRG